jgi:hypothetical protein
MYELTDDQIKDIAESLDIGMACYINKKTGEIVEILDRQSFPDVDSDSAWQEEIQRLEENWGDYFQIEKMPSQLAYDAMADFTELIDDVNLRNQIIKILQRPKSFRHFKYQIDNSLKYREKWFAFKLERSMEWVKKQIKNGDETD